MATEKTPNYTLAQVAIMRDMYEAKGEPLDLTDAEVLASDPRMNAADGSPRKARSIVAKIGRELIPYQRKVAVSKTGEAIQSKLDIVAEIGKVVSGNLDGLDKAPKPALVAVLKALAA